MGCSGCKKAKAAMQARIQQVQTITANVNPIIQKTPRQLRAEARTARIKARNDAAALLRQQGKI